MELPDSGPPVAGWAVWWPGWGEALADWDEPWSGSAGLLGWTESAGCASGPPWDSASPMSGLNEHHLRLGHKIMEDDL